MAQKHNPKTAPEAVAEDVSQKEVYNDSWYSSSGGLGSVRDKSVGVSFRARSRLPRREATALYVQNDVVAKIVDEIVDDAFRNGFTVENIKDRDRQPIEIEQEALQAKMKELGVFDRVPMAAKWARKDGGALLLLPVHDGQTVDKPARFNPETVFGYLGVVPSCRAQPEQQDLGLFSPTYGQTLEYLVESPTSDTKRVHHSRVVPIEAIELPYEDATAYSEDGWGPSVIERVFDVLQRDGASQQHAVNILWASSLLYLKLEGLRKAHTRKDGPEEIRKMLNGISRAIDTTGIVGLDSADDLAAVNRQISGLKDLLDHLRDRVASAANMPREILYNESPTGLRGGEMSGPQAIWYATVSKYQEKTLNPVLNRVLQVVFASLGVPAYSWDIAWPALFVERDSDAADTHKKRAEADQIYHNMGVLNADELRRERFEESEQGGLTVEPLDDVQDEVGDESDAPMPDDIIPVREAAARFGIPTRTLTLAMERDQLPYWSFNGRKVVSLAEVKKFGEKPFAGPDES